jgi:hypothetical protein
MTIECAPRSIRLSIWIDVQDDPRDLAPVGTFGGGIEHAQIRDAMFFIVNGKAWNGGCQIGHLDRGTAA